jgi:hypothetical protein
MMLETLGRERALGHERECLYEIREHEPFVQMTAFEAPTGQALQTGTYVVIAEKVAGELHDPVAYR